MKFRRLLPMAACAFLFTGISTNSLAACILTDLEVEVIIPTDLGIQELEVDVESSRGYSDNETFFLKKGQSDVMRPALTGDHFDIKIVEKDKFKDDKFPRVRAGCTSGNKVIKYRAAKLNVIWTVI